MHKHYLNTLTILLVLGMTGLLSSCSEDGLENRITGNWPFHTLITNCTPEDPTIMNAIVEADKSGCATFVYSDSTSAIILTYTETSCMSIFFKEDLSGYVITGDTDKLDSTHMTYSIDTTNNKMEICADNHNCVKYDYDGEEISIELPLVSAAITPKNCTRKFTYRKE